MEKLSDLDRAKLFLGRALYWHERRTSWAALEAAVEGIAVLLGVGAVAVLNEYLHKSTFPSPIEALHSVGNCMDAIARLEQLIAASSED